MLGYRWAVDLADHIAPLNGDRALELVADMLSLDLAVTGQEHVHERGRAIFIANHPTGIADGIALWQLIARKRRDISILANRDALRVNPRFSDVIIPVEWSAGKKTHGKSRHTLMKVDEALAGERALLVFPAGRLAWWNRQEGRLRERPWLPTVVGLARRYDCPVIPVGITAKNSTLFYRLSRMSDELRDITLFHEIINKRGQRWTMNIGAPISPAKLDGDAGSVTSALQAYVEDRLVRDASARFGQSLLTPA